MKLRHSATVVACVAASIGVGFGGCAGGVPQPSGSPTPTPSGGTGKVVVTSIHVEKDGLVAVGDGIIAFGTAPTSVGYIEPGDTTATPALDGVDAAAVYCAGTKIVSVSDGEVRAVVVYDTTTGTSTTVPDTDVWDIAPGANLENDNIAVDGNIVAILHRGELGKILKVIDVSAATPTVITFDFELTNAINVDVDAATGKVAVMEDNHFITVFPAAGPADVGPQQFNINDEAGVAITYTPKIRIGSNVVVFEELNTSRVFILNLTSGVSTEAAFNPAANGGTTGLVNKAGFYAYFLNRNADDSDASQGSRISIGTTNDLNNIAVASGAALADGAKSGFGHSAAITPNGTATYLAGRFGQSPGGGVNEPTFLQRATTQGFVLLTEANGGSVLAGDVVCNDAIAAFKVPDADNIGTTLGYFQP